jgi:hypothetical protein
MESNKKTVAVYTADNFLFQKILLDAPEWVSVVRGGESADLLLVDIDTVSVDEQKYVSMSRYGEADISIPFPLGTLAQILSSDTPGVQLTISREERAAYLRGEKIKLTELEFLLLERLMKNKGEFTSKDELLCDVWQNGKEAGIINVYIHYLREKLEAHGEKIIISSRKCGYKIDEKYTGGKENA